MDVFDMWDNIWWDYERVPNKQCSGRATLRNVYPISGLKSDSRGDKIL